MEIRMIFRNWNIAMRVEKILDDNLHYCRDSRLKSIMFEVEYITNIDSGFHFFCANVDFIVKFDEILQMQVVGSKRYLVGFNAIFEDGMTAAYYKTAWIAANNEMPIFQLFSTYLFTEFYILKYESGNFLTYNTQHEQYVEVDMKHVKSFVITDSEV